MASSIFLRAPKVVMPSSFRSWSKIIRRIPSSGLDLLDRGSEGLCPLASWTESHGAGLNTVSARDALAILP
ncbi:hypothetical protein EYF80_019167 [Liparis tanakae]|uniref:Uncharacterized protein n=1 Tax=Liparis tanakae TaxID=230148 RepID=A0A4Z2I030_9TELE|nr:hypothetical protein EYF80_019167 [Liparis tanakae]